MRTPIIPRRLSLAPIVSAAMLAALLLTSTANAEPVSADKLTANGWTCVPFAPANRTSCFNPGHGRPFPGNPDPLRRTHSWPSTSGLVASSGLGI